MNNPLLIIPTYFSKTHAVDLFDVCINTLRETTNAQVLVVDDCSPNPEMLKAAKEITSKHKDIDWYRNKENSGFAKTVNVGMNICLAEKRDAVLVNQDIEFIEHGWLEQMASNDADVIGAKLLYPNMLIQHAGIYFSSINRGFNHRFLYCLPTCPEANVPYRCPVTGALQYVKYETIEKVGIYDENFFLGYEDVDYNLRVLFSGGVCLYDPKVQALHHESVIRKGVKNDKQIESLRYMMEKYEHINFKDYVPNMLEKNNA